MMIDAIASATATRMMTITMAAIAPELNPLLDGVTTIVNKIILYIYTSQRDFTHLRPL